MTPLPTQVVSVENHSTVVSPTDFFNATWACAYQLLYQYGRSQWVKLGLAPPAKLVRLSGGAPPPAGAFHMILMDHSDEAGTLGWHDDEEGTGIPYCEVFCADALQDGKSVASVLSHEILETLGDPYVEPPRKPRTALHRNKLYIVELCDAVEGNDYDVGAPEGRRVGITVSDFCEPSWWALGGGAPYSYRQGVSAPFQLGPEGYISVADVRTPERFKPIFGEHISELPKWASRLPVVHGDITRDRVPPGPPAAPRPDGHRPVG